MAIAPAARHGYRAEINVTPMIDVLLVLLIIFMIVAPVIPKGLHALVPLPADEAGIAHPQDLVIDVLAPGVFELNRQPMDLPRLRGALARIFEGRGDSVVFLRGAANLEYRDVAEVIDIARGAGLGRVGLMTR